MTKHFDGLTVVSDMSLQLAKGEILGLIGPNGAGKTTMFNLLAGSLKPSSGGIFHRGARHFQPSARAEYRQRCRIQPKFSKYR